jgi:hypothetical protein
MQNTKNIPKAKPIPCRPDGAPIYEGTRAQREGGLPPICVKPADVFTCMENLTKTREKKIVRKTNFIPGKPQKPEKWG